MLTRIFKIQPDYFLLRVNMFTNYQNKLDRIDCHTSDE